MSNLNLPSSAPVKCFLKITLVLIKTENFFYKSDSFKFFCKMLNYECDEIVIFQLNKMWLSTLEPVQKFEIFSFLELSHFRA